MLGVERQARCSYVSWCLVTTYFAPLSSIGGAFDSGKDCRRSFRGAALSTRPRNLACTQPACFHCTLDRV